MTQKYITVVLMKSEDRKVPLDVRAVEYCPLLKTMLDEGGDDDDKEEIPLDLEYTVFTRIKYCITFFIEQGEVLCARPLPLGGKMPFVGRLSEYLKNFLFMD